MVDQVLTADKTNELKQEIYDYCRTRLGDGMVEVELDPKHYETGLITAIDKFKQRAESSVEESYGFLELQEDTNVYTCLLYTSPSPRDRTRSRMPSSA